MIGGAPQSLDVGYLFGRLRAQDLAAVAHLCGAGRANAFARRGFQPAAGERCGDHPMAAYLAKVNAMKRQFVRFAAARS